MVIDIKMCRFDNVPWGFRLVGGADFEIPLTVVKVTEGSIAELAGLRVGDVIVRINDIPASQLPHDESHQIITHCGNVFYFGVQRENENEFEEVPQHFPVQVASCPSAPHSLLDVGSSKTNSEDMRRSEEYLNDLNDRPNSVLSNGSETKLVDQEIAAVLSGESEVLKEHNVMGILPKPGVCMTSEVLRSLNEDAVKTKSEKEKENRKWTTFLQKPNRPIPRSKAQIEAERRAANAYKVKIIKSAPKTPSPLSYEPNNIESVREPEKYLDQKPVEEPRAAPMEPIEEIPTPTDSEVPNLVESNPPDLTNSLEDAKEQHQRMSEEKSDREMEAKPESKEMENEKFSNKESFSHETLLEAKDDKVDAQTEQKKTPEEIALEQQLADVQKQLLALSTLPATIQAALDAVTKQLAELLPAFKTTQQMPKIEVREINLESIAETKEEELEEKSWSETGNEFSRENQIAAEGTVEKDNEEETEIGSKGFKEKDTDSNRTQDMGDLHEDASQESPKLGRIIEDQNETYQREKETSLKKEKRHDVIEELEEHLECKNKTKSTKQHQRSKRAFGPLTPSSERPLVLPGGRRWYRPKDAYNDEFIAETLSAQAELITGTTLGNATYESPLLGYDPNMSNGASVTPFDRVNFMKYQKPEKKIDLNRSEVYKVIHHLDREPVRGIEVRPPVVPAAADIRRAIEL